MAAAASPRKWAPNQEPTPAKKALIGRRPLGWLWALGFGLWERPLSPRPNAQGPKPAVPCSFHQPHRAQVRQHQLLEGHGRRGEEVADAVRGAEALHPPAEGVELPPVG